MSYGAQDLAECNQRMESLERWYQVDGRNNKNHPHHGVYTGLYQLYRYHSVYGHGEPVEVPASTWS